MKWAIAHLPPPPPLVTPLLDQDVIRSFKCYYRQKLVKHIIAQCTLAQTADQISITVLDAKIKRIDSSWKNVTENIIKNGFRAAGFSKFSSTTSSINRLEIVRLINFFFFSLMRISLSKNEENGSIEKILLCVEEFQCGFALQRNGV